MHRVTGQGFPQLTTCDFPLVSDAANPTPPLAQFP